MSDETPALVGSPLLELPSDDVKLGYLDLNHWTLVVQASRFLTQAPRLNSGSLFGLTSSVVSCAQLPLARRRYRFAHIQPDPGCFGPARGSTRTEVSFLTTGQFRKLIARALDGISCALIWYVKLSGN